MKTSILFLTFAVIVGGCGDDPTGPAAGEFTASMSGAASASLTGNTTGNRVFSEAWPAGRYTISMIDPGTGENRLLLIECPDENVLQVRTYTLGASEQGCRGIYRRIGTPNFDVREEVISQTGMLTVTRVGETSIEGTFNFTGPLRTGTQEIGNVTLTGAFDAMRNH